MFISFQELNNLILVDFNSKQSSHFGMYQGKDYVVCLCIEFKLSFKFFKSFGVVMLAAVGSLHPHFFMKQFMIHDEIDGVVRKIRIVKRTADGDRIGLGGIST